MKPRRLFYFATPHACLAGALAACSAAFLAAPAVAVDGVILITADKALAGNVTPGDTAGFPVTLSQSGSYRLASDIQVPANENGIVVAAPNVTIDLNGFQLTGGTVASSGIVDARGGRSGVTVRNGTITLFKRDGIRSEGSYWTVENMRIVINGGNGVSARHLLQLRNSNIYLNKMNGVVSINWVIVAGSTFVANGLNGVVCDNHCLIEGNMISGNGYPDSGGDGVSVSIGTVLGNTITGNKGFGISGAATGYGNNTLLINNSGGAQVSVGLIPLQPNACSPAC